MKKVAIFDVDGTLLDTTEGVLSSVRYTIETHKLDMPSEEELKKFIGPPIQDSFQRIYGFEKADKIMYEEKKKKGKAR